jgi:hypothetical protein
MRTELPDTEPLHPLPIPVGIWRIWFWFAVLTESHGTVCSSQHLDPGLRELPHWIWNWPTLHSLISTVALSIFSVEIDFGLWSTTMWV